MELVKNKASGRYFVLLEEDAVGEAFLAITPEGKIKRLEWRLFEPVQVEVPKGSKKRPKLTQPQLMKYDEIAGQ